MNPVWLVVLGTLAACGDGPTAMADPNPYPPAPDDTVPYVYAVPPETGDGWRTGHLADVGLDEGRLTLLIDLIREGIYQKVHSVVIVKDGKLVLEEYFNGFSFEGTDGDSIFGTWTAFDRDTPHNLASVTKTVTSTLLGIAVRRGELPGLDTAVYDFFPEHADLRTSRKDSITLAHLATMGSGLEWDEATHPYGDPRNDISSMFIESDPIRYVLSRPAVEPPGSTWVYSGGSTNVLGDVIRRVSGRRLDDYADEHLLAPLGITDRSWVYLEDPVVYASGDMRLRPRDMAKIGYLYLNGGEWGGRAILSQEWIDAATAWYLETRNPGWGYGYQWWLYTFDVDGIGYPSYHARGWGGQLISVFPEQDMVVVQTGGNYLTEDPADAVLRQFVLGALQE